jgi:hypothetical protein
MQWHKGFGADMVLLLMVEDYQLTKMAETDYYKGFLGAQAALLNTAAGEKLWPELAESGVGGSIYRVWVK